MYLCMSVDIHMYIYICMHTHIHVHVSLRHIIMIINSKSVVQFMLQHAKFRFFFVGKYE